MDLDFYCHRPLHCLENLLFSRSQPRNSTSKVSDMLIVSREPFLHASLFRKSKRVIIQVGKVDEITTIFVSFILK